MNKTKAGEVVVTTAIIRKADVLKRIGLSEATLWRLERDGKFPRRVQLTETSVGWVEAEVDRWIHDRIRAGGRQPGRKQVAA